LIKTVLVDDHRIFCDGLDRVLKETGEFEVVAKFYSGHSLLEKINVLAPDLLIVDIEMPSLNGFDLIKRVRLNNIKVKIAVLSMHEESVFAQEAHMLGADAYLNKSIETSMLVQALQKTFHGEKIFPAGATVARIESPFSEREQEVLRLIAIGKTSEQIASRLNISHLTVKAHRRNMMRKINANNAAELISKALEMGFLPPIK